jgi:hypothetical protein
MPAALVLSLLPPGLAGLKTPLDFLDERVTDRVLPQVDGGEVLQVR